jgi:hypothetical protein
MIKETMSAAQRLEAAVRLQPTDRVPTAPIIGQFALRHRGIPQSTAYRDPQTSTQALMDTFESLGGYDGVMQPCFVWPYYSWRISAAPMPMLMAGQGTGDDEPLQAVEKEIMTLQDYDTLIERGWNGFCEELLPRVTGRPLEKIDARQKRLLQFFMEDLKKWQRFNAPVMHGATTCDPTMILSLCRTLTKFTTDLYRHPDKVQAAMDAMVDDLIENVINNIKVTGIPWVFFPLERGSGAIYPLKIFEKFGFPYLKKMVDAFAGKGFTSILHFDTDWTLNLPYLKDLPQGKCICELDSTTDIFKAKEILDGHMCIMGDVPASLLALGTQDQVTEYCEKLIDVVGKDGGFILSTGCECPVDAKFENVKAMLDSAKNHLPN